jgi:hypothetical protein
MKPVVAVPAALLLAAGVGFAVFPSAHASYVRRRAAGHVSDAGVLEQAMASPVAKQSLAGASDELKFAVMQTNTPVEEIGKLDDALVRLMASLKASPPTANPIDVAAVVEPSVTAGEAMTVRVSLHSQLAEAFLVSVTAQVGLEQGWQSSPVSKIFNQPIDRTSIDTPLEIRVPGDVSGPARVRATVTYRLNPTGEGMDLLAEPPAMPAFTIARGRQ